MIPFFQYNTVIIGPITLQVWGIMVSLGILISTLFAIYWCRKYLLSANVLTDLIIWSIIGGFIGARFFHVVFYNSGYYLQHLIEVLYIWNGGLSSVGGFIGALVAGLIFFKRRHFSFKEVLPYLDVGALSLWLGWGIGRIGCFLIHDHPGRLTDFFLAVDFPGGARFDLGLLDSILGFLIFFVFLFLFKPLVKKRWGLVFEFSFIAYGVARFFLDFLRATDLPQSDARYFYLTPAQWMILLAGLALTFMWFFCRIKQKHIENGRVA